MPCPTRLVHVPALNLTARVRADLTPACLARVLAELRTDIQATHARNASTRERGDSAS